MLPGARVLEEGAMHADVHTWGSAPGGWMRRQSGVTMAFFVFESCTRRRSLHSSPGVETGMALRKDEEHEGADLSQPAADVVRREDGFEEATGERNGEIVDEGAVGGVELE